MLPLKQATSLDNFIPGNNQQAIAGLNGCAQIKSGTYIYLWGARDTGKTHLITATARIADENGHAVAFIPLSRAQELAPEMLDGMEQTQLICLDDIHCIAGEPAWEEAIFHLFNRARERGTNLIIGADCSPSNLPIRLPDLASRLASGTSYRLEPLDDAAKIDFLIDKADKRGMDLTEDTASYILKNHSRDISALLELLKRLDHASLAAQRKLTIPFVRGLLIPE
jgi:DnaA family protein